MDEEKSNSSLIIRTINLSLQIFYDEKQDSYKICDGSGEDKRCSDKYLLDLDVADHLNYLGNVYLEWKE